MMHNFAVGWQWREICSHALTPDYILLTFPHVMWTRSKLYHHLLHIVERSAYDQHHNMNLHVLCVKFHNFFFAISNFLKHILNRMQWLIMLRRWKGSTTVDIYSTCNLRAFIVDSFVALIHIIVNHSHGTPVQHRFELCFGATWNIRTRYLPS